jgi:tetratricopeptide (TPR) repeat protein
MGFSFRKSIKIAPGLRLNMSKKGFGISVGVKGARVSVGPRGTNISSSVGPLQYRAKLGVNGSVSNPDRGPQFRAHEQIPSLKRPWNAHAWGIFLIFFFSTDLLLKLGESARGFATLGLITAWIFAMFKGPKKLRAYRLFKKTKIEDLDIPSRAEFLQKVYLSYPCDFIRSRLAKGLFENMQFDEALPHIRFLANLTRSQGHVLALGECYLRLSNFEQAITCFELVGEEDEQQNIVLIQVLKSEAYIGVKEYDKALVCILTGLQKQNVKFVEPQRELRVLKAKIENEIGDEAIARADLVQLLKEVPSFTKAIELIAAIDRKVA